MQLLLKKAIVVHLCTNDGFMLERPTRLELATSTLSLIHI